MNERDGQHAVLALRKSAPARDIAQLPRIVTLNDIAINNDKGQLAMDATARTYRYLDDDEVARQRRQQKEGAKK